MYRNGIGVVAGLVITSGLMLTAACANGDEKGAAPEVSFSVKSELARKLFFGFDLKAGIKSDSASKETKGGDAKGPDKKDIEWVPDSVVQTVSNGGPLPPMQQLAVNYKILLNRQGYITQVPETFVFQSGDQFRLLFQSNAPATVQILNKGTSGAAKVLFPDNRINAGANQIPAYQECAIPSTGWYRFDDKPGTEELHIIVTGTSAPPPQPAQSLATLCMPGATVTMRDWGQVVEVAISNHNKSVKAGNTKDIVLVDEGQSVIQVSSPPPPPPQNMGGLTPVNPPSAAQAMPTQTVITYAATTTVEETAPMLIQTLRLNHK